MRAYNTFNRLFYAKEIKRNQELFKSIKDKIAIYNNCRKAIQYSRSLMDLLDNHKRIFALGYQHANLDIDKYSMFRGKSIETLQPSEVYLGNIWGLWAHSISFWEDHKDEKYGYGGFNINPDTLIYDLILNQYKRHLLANIDYLYKQYIEQYKQFKVNNYV